jgi:hypothetical protein
MMIKCPECGLQADKIIQQISAATKTTTVQKSRSDMERMCKHLERRDDQSIFCSVMQLAEDVAPKSLKIKLFKGKDTYDLDKQQWDWRSTNPHINVVKQWPDEALALVMKPPRWGEKLTASDSVSRRLGYVE